MGAAEEGGGRAQRRDFSPHSALEAHTPVTRAGPGAPSVSLPYLRAPRCEACLSEDLEGLPEAPYTQPQAGEAGVEVHWSAASLSLDVPIHPGGQRAPPKSCHEGLLWGEH